MGAFGGAAVDAGVGPFVEQRALELGSPVGQDRFRGRRFHPTLRESSLPHQIATNRVGDWIGAELLPEHLLPARGRDQLQHRPDAIYQAAQPDDQGRSIVFLQVDLGHYSRQRVLGKMAAFLEHPDARSIVFAPPTAERASVIATWIREQYGDGIMPRTAAYLQRAVRERHA